LFEIFWSHMFDLCRWRVAAGRVSSREHFSQPNK